MNQADLSGRLARWSLKLQGYKFTIEHRKGTQNVVPDALSRVYAEEITLSPAKINLDTSPLHVDLNSPSFSELEYVTRIQEFKKLDKPPLNLKLINDKLVIHIPHNPSHEDTDVPEWKLWIPVSLTTSIVASAHNPPTAAHMGIAKTLDLIRRNFYWPGMTTDIKKYISNCTVCKQTKPTNMISQPMMGKYKEFTRPWQKLYLDFLGPYPRSKSGNTHILIVLDHYSRFVLLKPLREATAPKVVDYLEKEVFSLFSVPEVIHTDNGKQFISKVFGSLLEKYGIHHILTPSYSPQSNASERVNRSILSAIRAYVKDDHQTWDLHLHHVAFALRNTVHSSTTYAPAYLVFGQHSIQHGSEYKLRKLLGDDVLGNFDMESKTDRLALAKERVLFHLRQAYERSAHQYNLRSTDRQFQVGQKVFIKNFTQSDATKKYAAKLAYKFLPARVKRQVGTVAYELEDDNGKTIGVYHCKDIRP